MLHSRLYTHKCSFEQLSLMNESVLLAWPFWEEKCEIGKLMLLLTIYPPHFDRKDLGCTDRPMVFRNLPLRLFMAIKG